MRRCRTFCAATMTAPGFFLLLFAAKFVATSAHPRLGRSAAACSRPRSVIGAALGGAVGVVHRHLWPGLNTTVVRFRDRRHGGHARRHHRRGDHRHRHGVRADPRLQRHRADDPAVTLGDSRCAARCCRSRSTPGSSSRRATRCRMRSRPTCTASARPNASMSTDFEIRPAPATLDETIAALAETGRPLYRHDRRRQTAGGLSAARSRLQAVAVARRQAPRSATWRAPITSWRGRTTPCSDLIGRLARRGARLAIVVRAARACAARRRRRRRHRARDHGRGGDRQRARVRADRPRNPFPLLYRRRVARPVQFWRRRGHSDDTTPK